MTTTPLVSSAAAPRSSLIGQRVDPWLTGWIAVAGWIGLAIANRAGYTAPTGVLLWATLLVSGSHFMYSYRLTYRRRGTAVRQRPVQLIAAPLTLGVLAVVAVVADDLGDDDRLMRTGVFLVFIFTIWHYIKQVYGTIRIAARHASFQLSGREALVLRFGLYPLWLLAAYRTIASRFELPSSFTERSDLVSAGNHLGDLLAVALVAGVVCVVLGRASVRNRQLPPQGVVAPLVATLLWLGLTSSITVAALLLPMFHALQYLPFCHAAERGLESTDSRGRYVRLIISFAMLGVLVALWTPTVLSTIVPFGTTTDWLVVTFVFLNLHHYLIDAAIWRFDGELVPLLTRTA